MRLFGNFAIPYRFRDNFVIFWQSMSWTESAENSNRQGKGSGPSEHKIRQIKRKIFERKRRILSRIRKKTHYTVSIGNKIYLLFSVSHICKISMISIFTSYTICHECADFSSMFDVLNRTQKRIKLQIWLLNTCIHKKRWREKAEQRIRAAICFITFHPLVRGGHGDCRPFLFGLIASNVNAWSECKTAFRWYSS